MQIEIKEVQAKAILNPCGIPGIDYVINPYTGCAFGCTYCYASFMGRFVPGKTISDWGSFVYAKVNAGELLAKQLKKLPENGRGKEIFLSSVTDPYQGAEAKYKLTRKCLEIMAEEKTEATISILTKSHLITRDTDVLKRLKSVFAGLTVTSADDGISRYFERYAPNVTDRYKALEELNRKGIETYAFIGPLLPHFVAYTKQLEEVFAGLAKAGTRNIFAEHLNFSPYIRRRFLTEMRGADPALMADFYGSQSPDYRQELDAIVRKLAEKYGMNLMHDRTIYHKEFQKTGGRDNIGQLAVKG